MTPSHWLGLMEVKQTWWKNTISAAAPRRPSSSPRRTRRPLVSGFTKEEWGIVSVICPGRWPKAARQAGLTGIEGDRESLQVKQSCLQHVAYLNPSHAFSG